MAKEGTVAPKERVNITYRPATGQAQEQIELPLKFLLLADITGRPDPRPVEERAPISVDKDNFGRVMAEQKLRVDAMVPNRLLDEPGAEMSVSLNIGSLADFGPDGIASQVPALQQLLEVRNALIALKGPLGNLPAFRRKIQHLLANDQTRKQLASELGREQG
jgi:type VI secretion system protein ImpB